MHHLLPRESSDSKGHIHARGSPPLSGLFGAWQSRLVLLASVVVKAWTERNWRARPPRDSGRTWASTTLYTLNASAAHAAAVRVLRVDVGMREPRCRRTLRDVFHDTAEEVLPGVQELRKRAARIMIELVDIGVTIHA